MPYKDYSDIAVLSRGRVPLEPFRTELTRLLARDGFDLTGGVKLIGGRKKPLILLEERAELSVGMVGHMLGWDTPDMKSFDFDICDRLVCILNGDWRYDTLRDIYLAVNLAACEGE